MRSLIVILLFSLTGCATTQYNVNGVEPGNHQAIKVVGGILLLGALSKGMNKSCSNQQIIRDNNGKIIGTVGNC
jgi:hypothetical protein